MIAIKYLETTAGSCHDDRCTDTSCPTNKLHVPRKPFYRLSDTGTGNCPIILDMIGNEETNIVIRKWMKDVFIDKKSLSIPKEFAQETQRMIAKHNESLPKND